MNSQRLPLKQALKTFYSSKSLSGKQLCALHKILDQQQLKAQQATSTTVKWTGAIAATLLLFLSVSFYMHTPAVINAAYADIIKDADISNGLQASMEQWINENHIAAVPEQYRVEMSKFCHLDQYQTTHLRVAGVEQGKLHLFFHHGDHPLHWLNRSGSVDNMKWKLIKVRSDLTLIVMYTYDMRESAMRHIVDEMLPELQA